MDPEGILNACTMKTRIAKASSIARIMASEYSRISDLRRGEATLIVFGVVVASSI